MSSLIRCDQCGYENFPQHRFCGMCGNGLILPGSTAPRPISNYRKEFAPAGSIAETAPGAVASAPAPEPVPAATAEPVPAPVIPPYTEPPQPRAASFAYLLEDNPPPRRRTPYVILFLLLAVGTGVLWHRRQDVVAGFDAWSGRPSAVSSEKTQPAQPNPPASASPAMVSPSLPATRPVTATVVSPAAPTDSSIAPLPPESASAIKPSPDIEPNRLKKRELQPEPTRRAEQNNASAASSELEVEGEKYLYGNDVPQDCSRAQRNLTEAAKSDNVNAQNVLGTMYATGHCVSRDLPLAYHWFARASQKQPNNEKIDQDLRLVWNQMTPYERQLAVRTEH